jgi:hypothetical protein
LVADPADGASAHFFANIICGHMRTIDKKVAGAIFDKRPQSQARFRLTSRSFFASVETRISADAVVRVGGVADARCEWNKTKGAP